MINNSGSNKTISIPTTAQNYYKIFDNYTASVYIVDYDNDEILQVGDTDLLDNNGSRIQIFKKIFTIDFNS